MSNAFAIAAVTATLRSILQTHVPEQPDLSDTLVTILPLDKARGTNSFNQINIFLYMVTRNAAWVNEPMRGRVQPGETGIPPLPLNLYYLVTAFGRDDDTSQPFGHELLGRAMAILHDTPWLSGDDIRAATTGILPLSDLDRQPERVRVTFHPLSMDELSKLWTGFAMQLRLSAAYEVALTLIESSRAARTPIPVLTRGQTDRGAAVQSDLTPPVPTLVSVTPPNKQSGARLGDRITVDGVKLDGANVVLQLNHPLLAAPREVPPDAGNTATSASFTIPDAPAEIPAGIHAVAVLVQRPGETFRRSTNSLPLSIAPKLTLAPVAGAPGTIVLTATALPQVWPTQRASLLLNDREFDAAEHLAKTETLSFTAKSLAAGTWWARLRIDGVDSILIDRTQTPPAYDPSQKVVLT